ncbi:J domain-containing protein [Streptococcus infantis]|uniref:J domain-containing protein n=1 Tax=Streptococcus infantis TaxID=68892 RepID=UPI0039C1D572
MNKWEILGIEPTHDVKAIRKRYSELVKLYHPEDQPEIYQQIVEAYQSALREARFNRTRQETVGNETSPIQDFSRQEEKIVTSPLNFETLSEESTAHESNASSHVLDFSDYLESEYMIRNAIESIVGNPDYTVEEQEHLWQQFFNQYRYDMSTVQSVLEEMDVYIFNKPEQFSIIIPLLEDYIPDYKYWGYYYKLKHWKVKKATAYKNGESLEDAKKETAKLYASYRLCQALLEDTQKANQIGVWITFFKQSFSPGTVLFLLNSSKQMITSIPVLTYILEKIKPEVGEEDQKAYDELVAYFEELKANSEEPFDIHSYNLLDPSEVEEALYLLAYSTYQDDARLVQDWHYLLENVQDKSLLLQLLEDIDVYPFTNDKVLDLVFGFVRNHIKDEENPYLKKFSFWKDTHSYPWVVEKFSLNKKENFDYWYHQGYLYIDKITKSDEDINDWEKWKTYFKSKPRILAILLQQIYKEYHRFKDGELLLYVLGPFSTSKMVPMMMTEETDQKLEEMTNYAYQLCHPNSKISYLVWKKRQVFKNKFLQFVFGLFTIFSLILSVLEQHAMNSWVHAGMVSLFYVFMLKLRQTLIEEGIAARGLKQKFYYNLKPWILLILFMVFILPTLPLGLIGALAFITFFCSIDGFKISEGFKWDYSLDKLVPLGLFLSSGFLVVLANRSEMISYVAMCYIFIVMIVVGILYFTRYKIVLPPSLKGIFFPILMGIIFFQLLPFTHSRLSLFNPVILKNETLSLTFILLLNGIVLAYFTKEQRLAIGVKKTFMIYGLQIFIFLRRLFRILFAPIPDFSKVFFEKDLLIMNNEFAFYFLEWLFVLILLLVMRNIRKENRESID